MYAHILVKAISDALLMSEDQQHHMKSVLYLFEVAVDKNNPIMAALVAKFLRTHKDKIPHSDLQRMVFEKPNVGLALVDITAINV